MVSRGFCLALLMLVGIGCGGESGPELVPVTGAVQLNGKPLPGADVVFVPTEKTPGMGGSARTDDEGRFQLIYARGQEGVPAGSYRVTVSRRLMPDGTPVPPDDPTPPIESPARETLPPIFSSPEHTRLTATVEPNGQPIDLKLDAPPADR